MKDDVIVPYGYADRVAARVNKSKQTISDINNGRNRNPVLIAIVKDVVKELIAEDLELAKSEMPTN